MNQQSNVNTEISDAQANHATLTLLQIKEIHQHATDIAAQVADAQILIDHACVQLDELFDLPPASYKITAIINCFLTCAMRNVALISEENAIVLEMTGGAA